MAIDPSARYPGQITTGDPGYPHGKGRNESSPGARDGTPCEIDWWNDLAGFHQSLLNAAGITPSGTPDEVGASQLLEAVQKLRLGGPVPEVIGYEIQNTAKPRFFANFSVPSDTVDLFFRPDGTRMFVLRDGGTVEQYDSTGAAWHLIGFNSPNSGTLDISAQETAPRGFWFSNDGSRMFVSGLNSDAVSQYDLTTNWDVPTASLDASFDVSSETSFPGGVSFSSGSKMYVANLDALEAFQYDLTTSFDVATASLEATVTGFAGSSVTKVVLSDTGERAFSVDTTDTSIHQYTLEFGGDLSSLDFDEVSYKHPGPLTGLFFSSQGLRMFAFENQDDRVIERFANMVVGDHSV